MVSFKLTVPSVILLLTALPCFVCIWDAISSLRRGGLCDFPWELPVAVGPLLKAPFFFYFIQALDFEAAPEYNLVINATNPEPLVPGVQYNSSSLTLFKVFITNVDEAPVFRKPVYKAEVPEDIPVNTLVMTVEAYDPEGDTVR